MKKQNPALLCATFALVLLTTAAIGQKTNAKPANAAPAQPKQYFITVTTLHRNTDPDLTVDGWKAVEKEYLDKVVKNNPYIVGQDFLMHYFTADNTELLLVTAYNSWDDIEKASQKSDELEMSAWPDKPSRDAYFQKRAHYYARNHSDEIYQTFSGEKLPPSSFTTPVLYYVRVSHWSYPKDGSMEDFAKLNKEYTDKVTSKNEFIKAYYPNVHAWGANNTQFTEVFVVNSLADIEKGFDRDAELFKQAWPNEADRTAFGKKMDGYFDGTHGDYIYRLVPELSK
jgi:hypothetical protein